MYNDERSSVGMPPATLRVAECGTAGAVKAAFPTQERGIDRFDDWGFLFLARSP